MATFIGIENWRAGQNPYEMLDESCEARFQVPVPPILSGSSSVIDWISRVSSSPTSSSDQHHLESSLHNPSTPPSTSSPRPPSHISAPPNSAQPTPHTSSLDQERKRAASATYMKENRKRAASDSCVGAKKYRRVTPTIPSATHPLTRRALAEFTAKMVPARGGHPVTPDSSNKFYPPTSTSKASRETNNVANVRMSLAFQLMHCDDRKAYARYPALHQEVAKILDSDRNSAASDSSKRRVGEYLRVHGMENEQTLYGPLVDMVIPNTHTVPSNKRTLDDTVKMIEKCYTESGLDRKKDPLFLKGLLPADMEEERALALTTPKPDYVWGKEVPTYPTDRPGGDIKVLIGVCPGLWHPFLAIENVSADKPIDAGINQCIRDGAAMVNARRGLLGLLPGRPEKSGADLDSFVFCCAWSPDRLHLFVNWCEDRAENPPIFHMTLLEKYDLTVDYGPELVKFRHDIHNIWDWGLLTFITRGEDAVKKIMEARAEARRRTQEGTSVGV